MTPLHRVACAAIGGIATFTPLCPAALAQDAAQFYKGKTVEMVIPYGPGTGYDVYARLPVRHLGHHIPGAPTIVAKNMPGAGGLSGANFLYNVAAKDGSVIGTVNQNAPTHQIIGTAGIKYDARKYVWIGRVNSNVEVFHTWHTSPIKTIADAFKMEALAGGTGPTSSSVVMPNVLNQLVGTKFKVISGYSGSEATLLAMERGEVHGGVRPWAIIKTQSAQALKEKKINLIVQFTLERHPEIPDVPTAIDLAKTGEAREMLSLLASGSAIGRSIMAPPGLPDDRARTLRQAFAATMKDPALLAEAKKAGLDLDFMSGERLQDVVETIFDVSPSTAAKVKELTGGN